MHIFKANTSHTWNPRTRIILRPYTQNTLNITITLSRASSAQPASTSAREHAHAIRSVRNTVSTSKSMHIFKGNTSHIWNLRARIIQRPGTPNTANITSPVSNSPQYQRPKTFPFPPFPSPRPEVIKLLSQQEPGTVKSHTQLRQKGHNEIQFQPSAVRRCQETVEADTIPQLSIKSISPYRVPGNWGARSIAIHRRSTARLGIPRRRRIAEEDPAEWLANRRPTARDWHYQLFISPFPASSR